MKKLFIIATAVSLASCGAKNTVSENKQDSTKTNITDQVESTLSPITDITVDNAKSVTSFENTPESVVMYFFASRIRKDNEWEKVCLAADKRSDKLNRGLKEYDSWTFTKCKFVEKKEFEKNKFWVKVYMEITIEGEIDSGEDEATVELIDGKWVITGVPT